MVSCLSTIPVQFYEPMGIPRHHIPFRWHLFSLVLLVTLMTAVLLTATASVVGGTSPTAATTTTMRTRYTQRDSSDKGDVFSIRRKPQQTSAFLIGSDRRSAAAKPTKGNAIFEAAAVRTHQTLSTTITTATTMTRSSSATMKLQSSFFSNMNFDDILYQTQTWGNSLASISIQQDHNILTAIPIMYGAGLFTSFSPCVWGLLPLTISYISTAANERRDQQTLLPTIAFAAGLASVFCTMGMIAVSVGSVFGSNTANAASPGSAMAYTSIILPILSNLVCFVMGLKLLDLVDIPLLSLKFLDPQTLLAPTTAAGRSTPILLDATGRQVDTVAASNANGDDIGQQKQSEENALVRTFLLGGSSALVASPCATPVLTSILAYVANTMATVDSSSTVLSSTIMGGFLLLGYTLGYSTPLLIVAATSGQALVRLQQQPTDTTTTTTTTVPTDEHSMSTPTLTSFFTSIPNVIAPWVTPITGGILLYLGTTGLLVNVMGDPSLIGLTIIE
jgi:cytochrome c-type biogenesis protein